MLVQRCPCTVDSGVLGLLATRNVGLIQSSVTLSPDRQTERQTDTGAKTYSPSHGLQIRSTTDSMCPSIFQGEVLHGHDIRTKWSDCLIKTLSQSTQFICCMPLCRPAVTWFWCVNPCQRPPHQVYTHRASFPTKRPGDDNWARKLMGVRKDYSLQTTLEETIIIKLCENKLSAF